ncbi:hypothetical protein FACS1894217_13590 [Clostridia bacterium]|nr:hypothetical protein FACS1894217_13590 [Clostridia bacterium]
MAYLAINGYELPPPKRGVQPIVTTIVDAGRNANGAVVGQRVGRDQYKIDGLEWPWLTAQQWSQILSALSKFFVSVTFNDPVTNHRKTLKMYCGDRSAEPYWVGNNGEPTHYRDCKVSLIDTGE